VIEKPNTGPHRRLTSPIEVQADAQIGLICGAGDLGYTGHGNNSKTGNSER
jgi:hypothetical protein